jgi:hypothetical protein
MVKTKKQQPAKMSNEQYDDIVTDRMKELHGCDVVRPQAWSAGAIVAFSLLMLHEFSPAGGDGVVEVRFVNGKPLGVFVRAITDEEKTVPKNVYGKIANWELTPQQIAKLSGHPDPENAHFIDAAIDLSPLLVTPAGRSRTGHLAN